MVDPHLLASGVCEKERKSELNSRAAGKGMWHPSEGASRGAAAASKRARAARRRACGVGEVKLGLLARASRTTPTSARTMPPSHLTAKRHRRRTRRRRAVASQTTSAMRPPRRRGGRRVPAAGPSSVAGPASPSWPARLPTREDRARGQNVAKWEGPRTGGPGRRHDRPPGVRGRPGKWPKSDEFSKCEQPLRGVNSSRAGCGAVAPRESLAFLRRFQSKSTRNP